MADPGYIVIRLVPSSPVDGGTFSTYLDGLQLQVFDAATNQPLSDIAYSSPLSLFQWPPGANPNFASVSAPTTASGAFSSTGNYGNTLTFNSTDGISVGAYVFSADQNSANPVIPASSSITVVDVKAGVVTVNQTFPNYVPAGTVVNFFDQYSGNNPLNPGVSPPSFSLNTNAPATKNANSELVVLHFADATGVASGMTVTGSSVAAGTTVVEVAPAVKPTTVTVSLPLLSSTSPTSITFALQAPFASLTLTPKSSTSTQLTFPSPSGADGVAFGMTLNPGGVVKPGTTVTEATQTTVTLSQALSGPLPAGPVTFTFPLSAGIVQHVTVVENVTFGGISVVVTPASVATAIIPLNQPPPDYLNIKIAASRNSGADVIPINTTFYNVLVSFDALPPPFLYQSLSPDDTSLYLTLPPQPGTSPIPLTIPNDGSAPPFSALYTAIQTALSNDPILGQVTATTNADCAPGDASGGTQLTLIGSAASIGIKTGMLVNFVGGPNIAFGTAVKSVTAPSVSPAVVTLSAAVLSDVPIGSNIAFTNADVASVIASSETCTRVAYDIVWSYQNTLPDPPDPLESLYTNPPNPGNSGTSGSNEPVLEQDRQKFEGTLGSFYSTRNATAERLTKFVAAASAAVYCEQTSLHAAAALLEFPVDPSAAFATAVDSELLLQGLGVSGTAKIHFGVPAAFFYALGAKLDKSTTAPQRFQIHTGDTIERLLQEFVAADDAGLFVAPGVTADATASFVDPSYATSSITSFQAARRLVALGVSGASTSPSATVVAGSPLASLVNDWLAAVDPAVTSPPSPPPNPPQTYQNKDFNIWTQQLSQKDPAGYLELDLDALTQGFIIPAFPEHTSGDTPSGSKLIFVTPPPIAPSPIVAKTSADCPSGFALTFAASSGISGIGPGMSVSGTNIAPGTTVKSVAATSVTLDTAVLGDVPQGSIITFTENVGLGIGVGMPVHGTNIADGTTVQSVTTKAAPDHTTTTVMLSTGILGDIPNNTPITFNYTIAPITAATTKDCPSGTTLTFADGTTAGVKNGMVVSGTNIADGTTVQSVSGTSPPTVTIAPAVLNDVPNASLITFTTPVPPNTIPSTLADLIMAWLPSNATVATLIDVTAAQWTKFFTDNPTWLPPLTQPVAPGTSSTADSPTPGYIAGRIKAFIRHVQSFFTVSSVPTAFQPTPPGAPPIFTLPAFDPFSDLPAGFDFGNTLSSSDLQNTLTAAFPDSPTAQAWLSQAITTINELYEIASVVPNPTLPAGYSLPNPVSLSFSVMEALYARGFRDANDITTLSPDDFQQALIGTVAYDANLGTNALYHAAQLISKSSPPTESNGKTFHPVNPDGSLTNCVPPPCLSPTGPIAYLYELLKLSESSTCHDPWAAPASGHSTLGDSVAARRGPLGDLMASGANLQTSLPLIDIVNECLEYLGAAATPTGGTIYQTSADQFAGLELCKKGDCPDEDDRDCHEPEAVFAALPEHSTPAAFAPKTPPTQPAAYDNLKVDFSSCHLPYSQALDVSRTYLRLFGSSRFEEMRTFRKCITEFTLYPINPPSDFQSYLWRYPVRVETAIEYLGITPEEYAMLFQGTPPQPCAQSNDGNQQAPGAVPPWQLYGYGSPGDRNNWANEVLVLSEFLPRTCLTWCEFLDLSKSILTQFSNPRDQAPGGNQGNGGQGGNDGKPNAFPRCEPCCLKDYRIELPQGEGLPQTLAQIAVFIRLWRKLKDACGAEYSFDQLWDICSVLNWTTGGSINPEFIRQLAAFQMLRDQFDLPLTDPDDQAAGATGADRTQLLALWVGASAKKWRWAVDRLLEGIEGYARKRFGCEHRRRSATARMADHLDALSRLAGFNPPTSTNPSTDTWNNQPTNTLRFAEVLAKMRASRFSIEELLYLFSAESPHGPSNLFTFQDPEDALNYPLDLPEHDEHHSLWKLREALLKVEVRDEEVHEWTWSRIVSELRAKFGYAPPAGQDPLLSLGQHFFPDVLEASGYAVSSQQRQYRTKLTSSAAWNTPGSPFQYDTGSGELWTQLPLRDEAVAAKLSQLPQLSGSEPGAVQDLYFAPRLDLACVAFLFPDWQSTEIHLIEEREEHERWSYFRRHFALANARRKVIARHLARHVADKIDCDHDDLDDVAALVLSSLFSDENNGTPWELDTGVPPTVMWTPPAGGAVAALLGLVGTGLLGEYKVAQAPNNPGSATTPGAQDPSKAPAAPTTNLQIVWRDVRGPLEAFGHERDATNSPVPTVVPALVFAPAANPAVTFQNGYAVRNSDGRRLGGTQAFQVSWSGVLLVEREGEYAFHAGAPTPEGERPDFERAEKSQWRVTLKRGQRSWVVLNHQWPGEIDPGRHVSRLRPGAYQITVEFAQPAPDFTRPQQTSFQLKYTGPDSDGRLVTLPVKHLYRDFQDQTLDQGVTFLGGGKNAQLFLKAFYTSTLRDIRRTYQRAFKAVLFAGGLGLSARTIPEVDQSELGYMLANPQRFAGWAAYRIGPDSPTGPSPFHSHLAYFDFNFLPLQDDFHAPTAAPPDRATPSLQRRQALFHCWERIFDYHRVRKDGARRCEGPVWLLWNEAQVQQPTDTAQLLRHIGADAKYWNLDLRFYQDQNSPIYSVSDTDLQDDRWLVRVWHADRWNRALMHRFGPRDIGKARPDLWAAMDPAVPVNGSEPGNANLLELLVRSCLDDEPRRYADLKRLNDGLRTRGRDALLDYLCAMNRVLLNYQPGYAMVPQDIGNLLLIDVEAGLCERASRIEEAITAVQTFIRRARLGLEPTWKVTHQFAHLWEGRFATYRTWEVCKRRELYSENWIDWTERRRAQRIEAFRFLESQLRGATLTLAAPGGLDWWVDDDTPLESAPKLLQRRDPSELYPLSPLPPPATTREGLGTLGIPENPPLPTWLTPVPQAAASPPPPPNPNQPSSNQPVSNPPVSNQPGPSTPAANQPAAPKLAQTQAAPAPPAPAGDGMHQPLPLWMQSAMQMGTRFIRVAAAGIPQAALRFVPHHDEPEPACCEECGCEHPILMDEYYFWLVNTRFYSYTDQTDSQNSDDASFEGNYQFGFQDPYYDQFQQLSAEWNDEDQLPQLLAKWQPNPAVRLAWCRVHNGKFGQPRRSDECVQITAGASPPDLVFLGRAGDSLYFSVTDFALPLPPGYKDTSPPGFRYDLPWDRAVALPEVVKPPAPPTPSLYPGGLLSYPYFAYHEPGARLFPYTWFAPAIAVADVLRTHCRFELALRWYARAFDPLKRDCTWMDCPEGNRGGNSASGSAAGAQSGSGGTVGVVVGVQGGSPGGTTAPSVAAPNLSASEPSAATAAPAPQPAPAPNPQPAPAPGPQPAPAPSPQPTPAPTPQDGMPGEACCDSAKVGDEVARHRSIVLHFCETLLDWGDACWRHGHSPEAYAHARLAYDTAARILGPRPATVLMGEPASCKSVSAFVPAFAPLNPRLMDLYDLVADRIRSIHACINARRLRDGRPCLDMPYFGDSPLRDGWRTACDPCADENDWCHPESPYRFTYLIQKGIEMAGRLAAIGGALQTAWEKGEAEYLASMRAGHERELLALVLSIRQDQWRDADWQIQALQQTKDVSQTNLIYYNTLYQNGLINNEIQNLDLATNAIQSKTGANISEAYGEAMKVIPDIFVGFCSSDTQVPVGTKLAGVFETIAKVMQTIADIQSGTAAIDLTQAGWDRRSVDWFHQTVVLPIEIQQIELQLLGAHRRRDQALRELNNQQRQIENAIEVENFLRDKFMTTDLYLWQRAHLAGIYFQAYELTYRYARQLQHKFNFEFADYRRHFLPENAWDDLRAGLLAGERLELALRQMEKAYLDENVRRYELTKYFSLRLHFPIEFLRLKATGYCEIEIPEWMYDLDYPGHYKRQIKNVTLTIPCVTSRYTGVHCRLTLLSSVTRIDPRLAAPPHECCCPPRKHCCDADGRASGYALCPDDPRAIRHYAARQAIATSSGQNDSGMFEFNIRDERNFAFEFHGAACRLRMELPLENNYLDRDTLSDVVLQFNYTACEGDELLRRAASEAAQCHLPGGGWVYSDVRQEFPDAWQLFRDRPRHGEEARMLELRLGRKMFPYIPFHRELDVTGLVLMFETAGHCPSDCHEVKLLAADPDHDDYDRDVPDPGDTHREDQERDDWHHEDRHRDERHHEEWHRKDRHHEERNHEERSHEERNHEERHHDHRDHDEHDHEEGHHGERHRGERHGDERHGDERHRGESHREDRNHEERHRDGRHHEEWHGEDRHHDDDDRDRDACLRPIRCVRSCGWPKLYHGAVDVSLGRIGREDHHPRVRFRFPKDVGRVERVYVFWHYGLAERPEARRNGEDAPFANGFHATPTARSPGNRVPEEAYGPEHSHIS